MQRMKQILMLALFSFLMTETLMAAAGRNGASFLEIPVGAGPAALGSAYSALRR